MSSVELRQAGRIVLLTCDLHRSSLCLLLWSVIYSEDIAHYWEQSSIQPDWLEQMHTYSYLLTFTYSILFYPILL